EQGTAVLLISHDLPMVARYTHRFVVMERGVVVEQGTTEEILSRPKHPYTRKLLSALPHRMPARAVKASPVARITVDRLIVDFAARRSQLRKGQPKR
ncbi:glutathione ABC transporter ATP-binding protein GsiA, partial [Escherichia coli]|nr:glutathione ABC transporter ATP-binding protein GsiA [Escherichia coli]